MRAARSVSLWSVMLLGIALPMTVFTATGQGSPSPPQTGCTRTITRATDVHTALAAALPGDTLCFTGADLATANLALTKSGTAAAPIRLVSDAHTTVHEVHIIADHILVQGFTIVGGELLLTGTGLTAQKNTIRDAPRGGIICASCTDSIIQSNTVRHVTATGISISGRKITVRTNLVTRTVADDNGYADGVRIFGTDHLIISNTIQDIFASDDPTPAQPACFHTFDAGRPATFDIQIVGNNCQNVGTHCLAANGDESGNVDAPTNSRSIKFTGNTCATDGEQAVSLHRWPNVDLHKNRFYGPNLKRGILISGGSTGCTVRNNTTPDDIPGFDIDEASRPGFRDQNKNPF